MKACVLTLVICVLLISLSLNGTALHVGLTYNNATCYENKFIMSLSSWLIATTSVAITGASILGIYAFIQLFCGNEKIMAYGCITITIWVVISGLYCFIMNIIGIIELSYQFNACHNEVKYVAVMVIIIIVINTMSFLGFCGIKSN